MNTIRIVFLDGVVMELNLEDLQQSLEDVEITLDKESFSKLNCIKTKKTDESCTICVENYKKYQNLIVLDCNHYFHKRCIKKWLTKQSSKCPLCRTDTRTLIKK